MAQKVKKVLGIVIIAGILACTNNTSTDKDETAATTTKVSNVDVEHTDKGVEGTTKKTNQS